MSSSSMEPSYGTIKGSPLEEDIEAAVWGPDVQMRWQFIRKVYGIMAAQLALTVLVVLVIYKRLCSLGAFVLFFLAVLCALVPFARSHPTNLILLGLFSAAMSIPLGMSCAFFPPFLVLRAFFLTTALVLALTLFTFYASARGFDFSFLGPALTVGLVALTVVLLLQAFFPLPSVGQLLMSCAGATLFSLYLVYDTQQLLTRYSYDDYVLASLSMYLDIINLFQFILDILSRSGD